MTELPNDYPVQPVPFTAVRLTDAFWAPRIETNRTTTIPHAFARCEEKGRMQNFRIAAGLAEGEHAGTYPFDDTDIYKTLEGAAYSLHVHPDPELDAFLDDLIALVAAAQEEDGYLFTCAKNQAAQMPHRWEGGRWSKLQWSHELYNCGHLTEAAVAHFQATGKRELLDVAVRFCDLVARDFTPDGRRWPPGHQILEMALCRLYRVTGEARYVELARFLLDQRGRPHGGREPWGEYAQDHKPVLEQDEAVGHAVRAAYMYAGMADVAALTGDRAYADAVVRIWDNVVQKKLHVTGGIGATGSGEAFGANYELPNLTAYNETCAAIGNVYWNHRLFLLTGEAKYLDVLERTLYNGFVSGVSLDGTRFFYPNPLESRGRHERSEWFECSCCPSNVCRFIASLPGYVYAADGDTLTVGLYVRSEATVDIAGQPVRVTQDTDYPWTGAITLRVDPESAADFTLALRIPGWSRNEPVPSDLYRFLAASGEAPTLTVNGEPAPVAAADGFARITRTWQPGDVVELLLPMPVRRVLCHENVEANRGKAALQRGPLVYCAEWPDSPDAHVLNLFLPDDAPLSAERRDDLLGGVTVLTGPAVSLGTARDDGAPDRHATTLTAIPYYAWAHRGKGEMAVWLPRTEEATLPVPAPTLASRSTPSSSGGDASSINDLLEPSASNDHSYGFLHWWPKKGTVEWAQYDLPEPTTVSATEVYWFDDTGDGACRLPAAWRLLYRANDAWAEVPNPSTYGLTPDAYNRTTFSPVTTTALRLEVTLPPDFAAGIHQWRLDQ